MPFFTVLMTHPDGPGWGEHVRAHVDYLRDLVAKGPLKASGPLKGTPKRAGFLIFQADSRQAVEGLVQDDPFAVHGLIETLTIHEWDPLFGDYADESSGSLPGLGPTA